MDRSNEILQLRVGKMEIFWPVFLPDLNIALVYRQVPASFPLAENCLLQIELCPEELSVIEVLAGRRGGEEIHKCLEVTGQGICQSPERLPTQFCQMLGRREGSSGAPS